MSNYNVCFFLVENMWTIHVVCTYLEVPNLNEAFLRRTYVFCRERCGEYALLVLITNASFH